MTSIVCGRIERRPYELRVGLHWMDTDELRCYFLPNNLQAAIQALDPQPTKEEWDFLEAYLRFFSNGWDRDYKKGLQNRLAKDEIAASLPWWRDWMLLKDPKTVKFKNSGEPVTAYAEFNGGSSHVVVDDGCWVVLNDGVPAAWIFPEAMAVLRQLPDSPRNYAPYRESVGMAALPS
jgi:hypothetical protein